MFSSFVLNVSFRHSLIQIVGEEMIGHGNRAPVGVNGTLRSTDQVGAEGKDVTDLNVSKNILASK